MKTTVILKDFTDDFYNGVGESIKGLLNMTDEEKFAYLTNLGHQKRVSVKIGDGSFRDRVELNGMLRSPCKYTFKLEPRRGYKLATFDIVKA